MARSDTDGPDPAETPKRHRGWHSRGYLPHLDVASLTQFVTFRLADSVPARLLAQWQEQGRQESATSAARTTQRKVERYADAGHGACLLRQPRPARIVRDAMTHFDGDRYHLLAWCIMPNHVHALVQLSANGPALSQLVHSWKSWSAQEINKALRRHGSLWMPDYFDRFIRDNDHLATCIHYIRHNPVKAGLVARAEDWPWTG